MGAYSKAVRCSGGGKEKLDSLLRRFQWYPQGPSTVPIPARCSKMYKMNGLLYRRLRTPAPTGICWAPQDANPTDAVTLFSEFAHPARGPGKQGRETGSTGRRSQGPCVPCAPLALPTRECGTASCPAQPPSPRQTPPPTACHTVGSP